VKWKDEQLSKSININTGLELINLTLSF